MMKPYGNIFAFMAFLCIVGLLPGCKDSESVKTEFLVRVADQMITVADFNRALEVTKTAYSHNALQDPEILRSVQSRLLNQLIEELVLLERAGELGIHVSNEALDTAVARIKADYPEDTFEKTLLEYAVPFDVWKARLKIRLLKEKVISEELSKGIVITQEDVSAYIEKYGKDGRLEPDADKNAQDVDEMIVRNLRREKTEAAYLVWLRELRKKYLVEINRSEWKRISDS